MTSNYFDSMLSPLGEVILTANERGLTHLFFEGQRHAPVNRGDWRRDSGALRVAKWQLERYFAGELRQFELALDPSGTPFQRRVWAELRRIPFGETLSYGQIASRLGKPTAARAVGAANGQNPIAVVVPCHRVIGADRSLTGYAGGEQRKSWLLTLEGARFAGDAQLPLKNASTPETNALFSLSS